MPDTDALTPREYRRYGRHLTLPEVGQEGQLRLKRSSALVVGAGGLGSPVALYLAAAGVGRITLVDFDVVDASNLQRQVLFGEADIGRPKVVAAAARLGDLNPHVEIVPLNDRLSSANVESLVRSHDVVIDGSDNFTTRYLVNDACVLGGKPNVYGSIFRFEGQASLFRAPGPCYRCLFPDPPPPGLVPNCAQAGVLGVLPGLVGSIQAAEALKVLLGIGESLQGRLLLVDALRAGFREVRLRRDPACAVCGDHPTITRAVECTVEVCLDSTGVAGTAEVSPTDLAAEIASDTPPVLIDVREPWEHGAGALAGAVNMPLGDVSLRAGELPRDRAVVVYCRVGPRGRRALEMLTAEGLTRVRNLGGGLVAWRDEVDASIVVA
ncbi:MAG: molybdopterin-synthase adenylyltransferase MoeB [Planctomycetes bacterium]|nr:molybdopterin-synthase adenylyltransferase MoeB [Planctomycetota bacterium]